MISPQSSIRLLAILPAVVLFSSAPLSAQRDGATQMRFALGDEHSCALAERGRAFCWGRETQGELGRGAAEGRRNEASPQPVAGELSFVSIAAGGHHTCAVQAAGAVYCWGQGTRGQLGDGSARSSGAPVRVSSEETFVELTAGSTHTCGLTRAGAVFCWGDAGKGRLGAGPVSGGCRRDACSPAPVRVALPEAASALAAGEEFTCALGASGAAFCWGAGRSGQLGDGGTQDRDTPVPVTARSRFAQLATGKEHACAVTTAGAAFCWGENERGQLGAGDVDGSAGTRSGPTPVAGSLRWTRIAARDDHTCGLTASGRLYCWGASDDDLFGAQPVRSRERAPVAVTDAQFASFALGKEHACGVGRDGGAYCWGNNNRGQLGIPGRRRENTATPAFAIRTLPEIEAAASDPQSRNGSWAPNGLAAYENNLRSLLTSPAADPAEIRLALRRRGAPGDDLLSALYEGAVGHYTGDMGVSDSALQRASDLTDLRYTRSVSRAALAMVTNDGALAFAPSRTERRMIHYYGALNRLQRNDLPGAVVEARQLEALLQREDTDAGRDAPNAAERRTRAFLRYFSGAIFEAAHESNDADVAYRNAAALAGDSLMPRSAPAGARSTAANARSGSSRSGTASGRSGAGGARSGPGAARTGEVIVLVEWGFVPHRVEQELQIPLSVDEVQLLARDTTARRNQMANAVSGRVLSLLSSQPNEGVVYYGSRPSTLAGGRLEGEALRTLKLAWPVLYSEDAAAPRLTVVSPAGEVPMRLSANLADGVVADFSRDRPLMLARLVVRSAIKLAVVDEAERQATKRAGDILGGLVGLVANSAANALERADTRSWYLLPGSVSIARVRLPEGTHTLRLRMGNGASGTPVELGNVEVRAGGVSFLTSRVVDGDGTRMAVAPRPEVAGQ